jgi:hypothetical protein
MDLEEKIADMLWGQHDYQTINRLPAAEAACHVMRMLDDHMAEDTAWFVEQINHYRQRCEELEIEVEIERNSFNKMLKRGVTLS